MYVSALAIGGHHSSEVMMESMEGGTVQSPPVYLESQNAEEQDPPYT